MADVLDLGVHEESEILTNLLHIPIYVLAFFPGLLCSQTKCGKGLGMRVFMSLKFEHPS